MSNISEAKLALQQLIEGNLRFAANLRNKQPLASSKRAELIDGQEPFAVIVGCSDSRVPAEIVFDQGLGDLFVIRVAGNIVAPSQVGSVEFAISRFKTKLVVVLGHSNCGAINSTIDELLHGANNDSVNIKSIVDRVKPAVQGLMCGAAHMDIATLQDQAVRANVRASVQHLKTGSTILERAVLNDNLLIVGAEYSLETGIVDFFDGVPD
ncbi:MAG: carbonic anhydrase [Gammaproteobacteria bacterium]|nr:carbonic anhydrase [Gammaproteobacteria bacterium]